jgi:hypothetical protein
VNVSLCGARVRSCSGQHFVDRLLHSQSATDRPAASKESLPSWVRDVATALEVNLLPTGDFFGDLLAFEAEARDLNVSGEDGAGIASVTFRFFDSQGLSVYEHTENNTRYCAFGGGDNGQDCTVWRFSEHDNQWPSGNLVENGGFYRLLVIVEADSGEQTTRELEFTIQL